RTLRPVLVADQGTRRDDQPPRDVDAPRGRRGGGDRRQGLPARRLRPRATRNTRPGPPRQLRSLAADRRRRRRRAHPERWRAFARPPHPRRSRRGGPLRGHPRRIAALGGPRLGRHPRGGRGPRRGLRGNPVHARRVLTTSLVRARPINAGQPPPALLADISRNRYRGGKRCGARRFAATRATHLSPPPTALPSLNPISPPCPPVTRALIFATSTRNASHTSHDAKTLGVITVHIWSERHPLTERGTPARTAGRPSAPDHTG